MEDYSKLYKFYNKKLKVDMEYKELLSFEKCKLIRALILPRMRFAAITYFTFKKFYLYDLNFGIEYAVSIKRTNAPLWGGILLDFSGNISHNHLKLLDRLILRKEIKLIQKIIRGSNTVDFIMEK